MEIFAQALQQVRVENVGFGESVSLNTMKKMKSIINASVGNYYVRRWAERITDRAGETDFGKAKAVYDFLAVHTRYQKDPYGLELLKTPPVSLQLFEAGDVPALDCDDYVILSLSLLKSLGFPVALRASSYSQDKNFEHIYGLVKVGREWIPFDLVKKRGFGWEPPAPTRLYDMEV